MPDIFLGCPNCGELEIEQTEVKNVPQSYKETTVEADVRFCKICGTDIYDHELDQAAILKIYEAQGRIKIGSRYVLPNSTLALRQRLLQSAQDLKEAEEQNSKALENLSQKLIHRINQLKSRFQKTLNCLKKLKFW